MAYGLEIIIFYILGQTHALVPEIFGAKPLLILPILVMIAIFEGELTAFCFGIFAGVLLDVSFSWQLGFYTIISPVFGYLIGLASRNSAKSTIVYTIYVSTVTLFSIYSLHFFVHFIIGGYSEKLYAYFYHYLPNFLYTLATCPIFYYINRAFAAIISEENQPT